MTMDVEFQATDEDSSRAGWEACERKWLGPSAAGYPSEIDAAWELASLNTRPASTQEQREAIGPRSTGHITCEGCPAFKSEHWRDYLDNDETDSGTSAECTAAKKHITSYWRPNGAPPEWCPALLQGREGGR